MDHLPDAAKCSVRGNFECHCGGVPMQDVLVVSLCRCFSVTVGNGCDSAVEQCIAMEVDCLLDMATCSVLGNLSSATVEASSRCEMCLW